MPMNNFQIYVEDNKKIQKLPNCNSIISEINRYCTITYSKYYNKRYRGDTYSFIQKSFLIRFKLCRQIVMANLLGSG